jgi:hypothetical protein
MFTIGPTHALAALVSAPVDLNHPGHYLHWGVIQLSLANFVVIVIMVVLFLLAIFVPFPKGRSRR